MRSVITEAKVTRRFNTGDYNHEEYTLGAVVDERETGTEVLVELKKQIHEAFTGEVSAVGAENPTTTKPAKKADKKEEKKNVKGKPSNTDDENTDDEDSTEEASGDEDESTLDDEAAVSEDGDDSDDSSETSDDSAEDEQEEEAKPAKSSKSSSGKEGSGKKKFKQRAQNYDRTIEQHKEIFSKLLGLVAPDWKKSDVTKARAKKTSESLAGKPFLDENGDTLESFKSEVKKLMIVKKK